MASETAAGSSLDSLRAEFNKYFTNADAESSSSEAPGAKIKRVPTRLRKRMPGAAQYFEPTLLYLGPFQWAKDIPKESKRLKKKFATVFMRVIGDSDRRFEACEKIYNEFDSLMKCYELIAGEEQVSSERRIEEQQTRTREVISLFEDGCAILYLICPKDERFTKASKDVHVPVPIDDPRIVTDILRLENQIPYRVLTLLMESAYNDSVKRGSLIENFIALQISTLTTKRAQPRDEVSSLAAPVHLLQHLRERLVGIPPPTATEPSRTLSLESRSLYFKGSSRKFSSSSDKSATSLKSRNIDFSDAVFNNNLTNISCDRGNRRVNIPSIAFNTSSLSILMNLVADEVSSDISNRLEISSFLHFLDKLVYSPEDAKVLREANVIRNSISDDKEAGAFLNATAALLPTNAELFQDAEKYIKDLFENDPLRWMNQLSNQYFSSPWAVIAFVGGMLILSLTMLQTYVTIFPVPEELVKNLNQWKVIYYLMKRIFTAVLLPLPLLFTLLWILLIIIVIVASIYFMPRQTRRRWALSIALIVMIAIGGFCYNEIETRTNNKNEEHKI